MLSILWPDLFYACKNSQRWFQVELAVNGRLMLHPWKDAAILKCSHLIFSKAAMCLIASLLSITITGCVLSEGTCRTTLNPLQPDLDKGQPRLARRFWSHCLRARENYGCLCCCQCNIAIYSKDRMIRLTPNHWQCTSVYMNSMATQHSL